MSLTTEEYQRIDNLLARLGNCDLSEWDLDFVDDQIKRLGRYGEDAAFSARQLDQLDRMERQYL
jgi:hypothetical protein